VIAPDPLLGICVVAAGQAVAFAAVSSFCAWRLGLGSLCLCVRALSRVLLDLLLLQTKPLLVHTISEAAWNLILQVSTAASVDLIGILLHHHVEVLELFFFSLSFVLVQVHLALLQGVALSLELLVQLLFYFHTFFLWFICCGLWVLIRRACCRHVRVAGLINLFGSGF
jgi:hypothetical protein